MLCLLILFVFVSIVVSVGAEIQKSIMSIADHVNLGFMEKIDPKKFKVVGITTIYGINDDDCIKDLINKANSQKAWELIGIFDFSFNLVATSSSDNNRYVHSKLFATCAGTALIEK